MKISRTKNLIIAFAFSGIFSFLLAGSAQASQSTLITVPDKGGTAQVRLFDSSGKVRYTAGFFAYAQTLRSGFSLAVGDLNGDGVDEIVVAPRAQAAPHVRVFDHEGKAVFTPGFFAYAQDSRCGVDVATGDVNGDGRDEIITVPGPGCGSEVKIFDYRGQSFGDKTFHAYPLNVRSGFRVAAGDLNGDLIDEIIVVPGQGVPAQVRIFDAAGKAKFTPGFFAYGSLKTGGDVAVGDLNFDGQDEIVTTPGPGYPAQVRIFNYKGQPILHPGFYAYAQQVKTGASVSVGDIDRDGRAEIITVPLSNAPAQVRMFNYRGQAKFSPGWYAYGSNTKSGGDVAIGIFDDKPTVDVDAALVWWDQEGGFNTIISQVDKFTSISPFWYRLTAEGEVRLFENAEDKKITSYLRRNHIKIIPSVSNEQNREPLASIIAESKRRTAHVEELVDLVTNRNYDGLHLNYENLGASDRDNFTALVRELADALHQHGKMLSLSLHAKTEEPGNWDGPLAQDWAALGSAADRLKLMAYDYHWATSLAGAIAPVDWVRSVLQHAVTLIPRDRISLGIGLYGYDWVGSIGEGVTYGHVCNLSRDYAAGIVFDEISKSPNLNYFIGSENHNVWFENSRSTAYKLDLAKQYGTGGINFWRLGDEDPETWNKVDQFF